jgi:hypothetical protein
LSLQLKALRAEKVNPLISLAFQANGWIRNEKRGCRQVSEQRSDRYLWVVDGIAKPKEVGE